MVHKAVFFLPSFSHCFSSAPDRKFLNDLVQARKLSSRAKTFYFFKTTPLIYIFITCIHHVQLGFKFFDARCKKKKTFLEKDKNLHSHTHENVFLNQILQLYNLYFNIYIIISTIIISTSTIILLL